MRAFFRGIVPVLSLLAVAACDGGGGGSGGSGASGGSGGGGAAGGGGGGGSGGGSGGGGDYCFSELQDGVFDQACAAPADCLVKYHAVDCCGSLHAVGINQADGAAFDAAEAQCQPTCDCAAQPTVADDGQTSADPAAFQVDCLAGACSTFVQ